MKSNPKDAARRRAFLAAGKTVLTFTLLAFFLSPALQAAPVYTNDFNQAKVGATPADFLVLNGEFTVQKENEESWLELSGTPLDTYGLLFGPTFAPKSEPGVTARADFYATARGRRLPAFAVGACGGGGFRLQVTPAKQQLELFRGDTVLVAQPMEWKNESWTSLRLEVVRRGDAWLIRGKVWPRGQPEPAIWQIEHTTQEEPIPGRASIWGVPFSGRPMRFDNLAVDAVPAQ